MIISRQFRKFFLLWVALSFLFHPIGQLFACGPFFTEYIYEEIDKYYPPKKEESFIDYYDDIILSNWGPEYIYPVYRDLLGQSLGEEAKEYIKKLYSGDLFITDYWPQESSPLGQAIEEWKEARKVVTEQEVEIVPYGSERYLSYVNCLPDAFLTAAATLKDRVKVYDESQLELWLNKQDAVFESCKGGEQKSTSGPSRYFFASLISGGNGLFWKFFSWLKEFFVDIFSKIVNFFKRLFWTKEAASPVQPPYTKKISPSELLGYDTEYQDAATSFYKGDYAVAEERFRKIGVNLEHPWRAYANLVLGRTYIRQGYHHYYQVWQGSIGESDYKEQEAKAIKVRDDWFGKARSQFEDIIKDESLSSVHKSARSLLNYVNFRIDPKKRLKDAEEVLLLSDDPEEIVYALEDFSLLWYKKLYEKAYRNRIDEEYEEYEKYILENGSDFLQWSYVWWSSRGDHLDLAVEKYHQQKTLPWLLTSLKWMTLDHPFSKEIIEASREISKDSPGYLTALYYSIKALAQNEENWEEVRRELDSVLAEINPQESPVAYNYFQELRQGVAVGLEDFLSFSQRKLIFTSIFWIPDSVSQEEYEEVFFMGKKTKQVFNELLPLEKWVEIILSKDIFEQDVREYLAATAFVRATLLGNLDIASQLATYLSDKDPLLNKELGNFLATRKEDEKRFAVILFILKHPSTNAFLDYNFDEAMFSSSLADFLNNEDHHRGNWWYDYSSYEYDLKKVRIFSSAEELDKASSENSQMYSITAPNFLIAGVINYALKNPEDSRVPEALHLSVIAARYSAQRDEKTSTLSQQAFQILHNNYPGNYWTTITPYWY